MALFQQSVLTKYIKSFDEKLLETKWNAFTNIFHNAEKQNNIRNSKEEQYQEGFLRDLFVQIFGYTINPETNFNLLTEQKNITNAKKADGAIVLPGSNGLQSVVAVIELKGTDTTDLSKIETQAFGYKNNQPECVYVITSNFEKLRFYIENAVDFIEFNLFNLSKEEFKMLYVCLAFENIKANIPKQLKDESVSNENKITKQLYKDYSDFKRALFNNLVEKNPDIDKLLLFKKTQKLLDRFLFIFFAEDRHLVPTNLIRRINLEWEKLKEMRIPVSLYDRYKIYFEDLNSGAKVTLPAFGKKTGDAITAEFEIFAYNGGLFAADELLDNVQIDDEILYKHTILLSDYDFDSDVDVNILGHIFENSLNEIDEIKSEIEGKEIDKSKTKRKKDGVFYTPKYITKYIVDNTVGKLCEEKKAEFGIIDEEFAKGRKNRNKTTIEKLDAQLHAYRDWLLQITICDPACGSGAFLNQALEFLIQEHKYIDNLEAQLLGNAIGFPGAELHILENNIYGVDLNDESIEIAKLSLWLRTAQKGRKLNSLNNNIKCGNSLIDDPEIAGDKAFSWEKEFPEVFDPSTGSGGGFDVIIGNPPYGATLDILSSNQLVEKFPIVPSKIKDTYFYFVLLSIDLIKENGYLSFIIPNTWLLINNASNFRKFMLEYDLIAIIDHGDAVFEDAIVESSTFILKKQKANINNVLVEKYKNGLLTISQQVQTKIWKKDEYCRIAIEAKNNDVKFIQKLEKISNPFSFTSEIIFGIKPYQVGHGVPAQTREMLDKRIYHSKEQINTNWKPLLTGTDIGRYLLNFNNEFILYGKNLMYSSNESKIKEDKLLLRRTSADLRVVFDNESFYPQNSLFIITSTLNLKFLLSLLNSRLFDFIYKTKCPQVGKVFAEVKPSIIKSLPILKIDEVRQKPLIELAERMLLNTRKNQFTITKFTTYFSSQYNLEKLPGKLEKWYDLTFIDFIKELNKTIKSVKGTPLTKKDEFEWIDLFEENKKKALEIKAEIDKTDKEIDQMVYALYGLTEEEIKIVEGV